MRRMMTIGALALAVAAVAAQTPQIQNAQVKTQAVTSLSRDVAALAAQATTPQWVAWQVPMSDGERNLCCFYSDDAMSSGVRGCRIEPQATDAPPTPPQFPAPTGPVRLEAGTQVTIFVRLVEKRIERMRALTDDCPVDAGGLSLHWLTGVSGADSVAWLKARAVDETMDVDVKSRIASAAVRAIALHRDPSAVATLIEFARSTPLTPTATSVRREAMNGLGQSRDPRALQFLQSVITK
ncbi:MAG TPA: HEAT repeat domain-containing protein [Vicinamibacterales bacterium]|nr:HEAT repeat domain-containing protein [Vicinamibacterales bacterium]